MSTICLREITFDQVREIASLDVAPEQRGFVAPNAISIAEGLLNPGAWLRAVYDGDLPVGFVMLLDPRRPGAMSRSPIYPDSVFLWRLMIDRRYQKLGYARAALDQVCTHARSTGAHRIYSSYVPGEQGPEGFYQRYGFTTTGRQRANGSEVEIQLDLQRPAAP